MTDTIRTEAELLAMFADGQGAGSMSPQTMRDFVVSTTAATAAISELITATTVDVFMWDISQDSDGGAWADKTSDTAWYNELLNTATRGATKNIPAKGVGVVEASQVTLYDATDSVLSMWMVFQQGGTYPAISMLGRTVPNITSAALKHGLLCVSLDNAGYGEALACIDFKTDQAVMYSDANSSWSCPHTIAERNDEKTITIDSSLPSIIGLDSRYVDISVYQNEVIIAVATQKGVSVVYADGTTYDLTDATGIGGLYFMGDDRLWLSAMAGSTDIQSIGDIPLQDDTVANWSDVFYDKANSIPALLNNSTGQLLALDAVGGLSGVTLFLDVNSVYAEAIVAYVAADYNSGWMQGDIKGAFLANSATLDRSVNANPLTATGVLTEASVSTGAELMGYSGFSAAIYLEGTDASYVDTLYNYGWVKHAANGWEFKHGVVSAGDIDGLTIVATVLHVEGTLPKALIRVGEQPSARQLEQIEKDERMLFQENALCTLSGASSDIRALALDKVTNELHICTVTDRSVFNGLVRVGEENAAYTSIAANNRLIAKGN